MFSIRVDNNPLIHYIWDSMNRNHPLVHRLNAYLNTMGLPQKSHWLLAVSGGADSVALFHLCRVLSRIHGFEFSVAHVHHGDSPDPDQKQYRDQAREFCKNLSLEYEIPFFTNETFPDTSLKSEAGFREFRWSFLKSCSQRLKSEWKVPVIVAVAHNREDALETRLIHLIRGSGEQGLRGLQGFGDGKVRPLLETRRQEVREFLESQGLSWEEDPSNSRLEPLRNWIRQQWLPALDAHRPGSTESLARSLENLARAVSDTHSQLPSKELFNGQALRRDVFLQLSRQQKRQAVALFLSQQGVEGFTSGHVEEFLKRLDTDRKDLSFKMLSVQWKISSDTIQASRV